MYFSADQRHAVVGMELKGPDNSLRVRQIRILGEIEGESLKVGKQLSAQTIQQRNCEAETLKVFRLITSQVFTLRFSLFTLFEYETVFHYFASYFRYLENLYKEKSNNMRNRRKVMVLTRRWRIVTICGNIWSGYYSAGAT